MRKLFVFLCLLVLPQIGQAWVIESFDVVADIQTDGSVVITETITGDFSRDRQKRGIFRDIPFRYEEPKTGKLYKTPLKVLSITDQANRPRPYKVTTKEAYKSFRIGDPNAYVQATEVYKIKYRVTGVLQSFETHDEFYWNVSGDQWDAQKKQILMTVNLPAESKTLKTKCYTGISGSKDVNCEHLVAEKNGGIYVTTQPLSSDEDLTIVFGFDKGLVKMVDRKYQNKWLTKLFESPLLTFFISLLSVPFVIIRSFYKKWKLRQAWGPIVPAYEPPADLSLGEIGLLYDGKSDSRDLTAVILSLCTKGYLSIEVLDKTWPFGDDYKFNNLKPADSQLSSLEKFVHDGIFTKLESSVLLSDFTKSREITPRMSLLRPELGYKTPIFSATGFSAFGAHVSTDLTSKNFYKKGSPIFFIFAFFLFPLFFVLLFIFPGAESLIPLIIAAFVIGVSFMTQSLSPLGNQKRYEIECYKEFLETADKDRLDWSAAQNIFEKNLPYAVNLGVSDKWASLFAGHVSNPNWYLASGSDFKIQNFIKSMNGLSSNVSRSFAAPKSSSGSGFSSSSGSSGGGSGGGGGGSW